MGNMYQNLIVLGICWVLISGGGIYMTFFDQPGEMERLEKAEEVAKLRQAEVTSLMDEVTQSKSASEQILRRWKSRYKIIPEELGSEEVIGYLNHLTATGFNPFDVSFMEQVNGAKVNKYVFDITGRGSFRDVYGMIWDIENDRKFYRVNDLQLNHFDLVTTDKDTQREELKIMVSFSFILEAYYGGMEGLSASDDLAASDGETDELAAPLADVNQLPPGIVAAKRPALNPFFPLILDNIPPNTDGLLEMDKAELVSIVGGAAVFDVDGEFLSLNVGDKVYLGQITEIDPRTGIVRARLNKGGIVDEIELQLETGDQFRQALGPVRLAPSTSN